MTLHFSRENNMFNTARTFQYSEGTMYFDLPRIENFNRSGQAVGDMPVDSCSMSIVNVATPPLEAPHSCII
jgi:hypothetical protein